MQSKAVAGCQSIGEGDVMWEGRGQALATKSHDGICRAVIGLSSSSTTEGAEEGRWTAASHQDRARPSHGETWGIPAALCGWSGRHARLERELSSAQNR